MSDFSITSLSGEEIILKEKVSSIIQYNALAGASQYYLEADFGGMIFQEYKGDGFTIWFSQYTITRKVSLVARGDIAVLELQIPLDDNFESIWDGFGETALKQSEFEMSYAPFIHNKAILLPRRYRTFDIHYGLSFLESFEAQFPPLTEFINKVIKQEPVHLFGAKQILTPDMYKLVSDLIHCKHTGIVAHRFYESSVTILLIKILERISIVNPTIYRITPVDVERAMEAKRIINSDFEQFHSIPQLCRKVGTNIFKLKNAFKQVHGVSIFRYSQQARIEYAAKLLMETDYTNQTIAEMAGYTEGNNFQVTFKRLMGCTPGVYRKNVKR